MEDKDGKRWKDGERCKRSLIISRLRAPIVKQHEKYYIYIF